MIDHRLVGRHRRARLRTSGTTGCRGAAAAALQREDEVEQHPLSLSAPYDTSRARRTWVTPTRARDMALTKVHSSARSTSAESLTVGASVEAEDS